jgi:hypothetical protein
MSNSTLQLRSDPAMRGRIMALFAVAFLGSTPIGAPIVGAVAQAWGARAALALGGVAALLAAVLTARRDRLASAASDRSPEAEHEEAGDGDGKEHHRDDAEAGDARGEAYDEQGSSGELRGVAHQEVPPEPSESLERSSDGHGDTASRRTRRRAATDPKVKAT